MYLANNSKIKLLYFQEEKKQINKLRYNKIDIIKGIACFGVTYIHNPFPGFFGKVIKTINRYAVPFFYFISGFFFLNANKEITNSRIIHKIKHILRIIKKSGIFYFIFCICYHFLKDKKFKIKLLIKTLFTKKKIILFFLYNFPFLYSHFWFILALLYSYLFMLVLNSVNKRIITNKYFECFFASFAIIEYFIKIIFMNYKIFNTKSNITSLFLFRAFPSIMIGIYFRKNKKLKKICSLTLIFIMGSCIACLEMILLKKKINRLLGTYIQLISLIYLCLKDEKAIVKKYKFFAFIGRKLSDKIYIYHIAVGKTIELIFKKLSLINQSWFLYSKFILVLSSTIIFSYLIEKYKALKISS